MVLVELVTEKITDAEERRAAIDVELETLREIETLAYKLNGIVLPDREPAQTSTRRSPVPPREPAVARAQAPAGGDKASAGRRPDTANRPVSRGGASAAGRPAKYPVPEPDVLLYRVAQVLEQAREPLSASAILRALEGPASKGGTAAKWLDAIRAACAQLVAHDVARPGRPNRGNPTYEGVRPAASLRRNAPSTAHIDPALKTLPAPEPSNPVDQLLEQIIEYVTENGPRRREDLKQELGNPFEEEFRLALDRGITLKRIQKVTQQGGRIVYRNMGGER